MPELSVPIPNDFFQLPRLTQTDIERYQAVGHEFVKLFVDVAKIKYGTIDWSIQSKTPEITVFECRANHVPMHLVRTEINATLEEAIAVFQTTTLTETRKLQAEVQPLVLDKVRLYNVTLPTPENPYLFQSLNWAVVDTTYPKFVLKRRDFCFIEHQDVVQFEGKRAFVRAMKSIELACVPSLEGSFDVVRGEMLHYGSVFVETDRPGVLQLLTVYHIQPNGNTKGALGEKLMRKSLEGHYRTIHDVEQVIRSHHLGHLTFLDPTSMPPLDSQVKCEICTKYFGRRRKTQCRHCAKIVCSRKCSAKWKVMRSGLELNVRLCSGCSKQSQGQPSSTNSSMSTDSVAEYLQSMTTTDDFSCYEESVVSVELRQDYKVTRITITDY
ncbi:hypothetical protein LEN26_015606 [Aphanomyces euteiches]|nr:hypothetical protein LEN26_015606 [Aphanomyces euteiches]KAH9123833.1 hypothetical protein AeMF1_005304 [Aphanomyces euteiches]